MTIEPSGPAQEAPDPDTAPDAGTTAPPWERDGTEFDAARAWTLITNLRAEVAAAKTPAPPPAVADEPESNPATDTAARVAALESALARERVGRKHSLPDGVIDLLGDGDEDALSARATALIEWAVTQQQPAAPAPASLRRRPLADLRPGTTNPADTPTETDPAALAAAVMSARGRH